MELVHGEGSVAETVGEVIHDADRGVRKPHFGSQHALRRHGHSDQIRDRGERAYFRRGFKPGSVGLGVDPAVDQRSRGGAGPRSDHRRAPGRIEAGYKMAAFVVVEGGGLVGGVTVVSRNHGTDRPVQAEAPHGRQRQDPVDIGGEECRDV